jgi:flagellar assembly protein FliH
MRNMRPHRFPPLSQVSVGNSPAANAQLQLTQADAFKEGMDRGYREGYDIGIEAGREPGWPMRGAKCSNASMRWPPP